MKEVEVFFPTLVVTGGGGGGLGFFPTNNI